LKYGIGHPFFLLNSNKYATSAPPPTSAYMRWFGELVALAPGGANGGDATVGAYTGVERW